MLCHGRAPQFKSPTKGQLPAATKKFSTPWPPVSPNLSLRGAGGDAAISGRGDCCAFPSALGEWLAMTSDWGTLPSPRQGHNSSRPQPMPTMVSARSIMSTRAILSRRYPGSTGGTWRQASTQGGKRRPASFPAWRPLRRRWAAWPALPP
jgi:hypothetical protein